VLVLTRREGETIVIGANAIIRVTVTNIGGDKVRIGIEAPPEVPVHREEIWKAIERERGQK
jgi:carbon storage regulator